LVFFLFFLFCGYHTKRLAIRALEDGLCYSRCGCGGGEGQQKEFVKYNKREWRWKRAKEVEEEGSKDAFFFFFFTIATSTTQHSIAYHLPPIEILPTSPWVLGVAAGRNPWPSQQGPRVNLVHGSRVAAWQDRKTQKAHIHKRVYGASGQSGKQGEATRTRMGPWWPHCCC
jgi:hypothetical protein